jgi:hypothetical protein
MSEHLFTMSFINGNPGFVINCDTPEELDKAIAETLPIFKKFKVAVDTYKEKQQNMAAPPPGTSPTCGVHNIQMVWHVPGVSKAGKPYQGFYACPAKNPDGSWCDYKAK